MDILELQEKRNGLKDQLNKMVETAEAETRKLNDEETNQMAQIKKEIADLDNEIRTIEKENEELTKNKKEVKKSFRMNLNLIKTINEVANNRSLDEATQNEIDAAKAEFRKSGLSTKGQIQLRTVINTANPGQGQENVEEVKTPIELALRDALVARKIGANYMSGLVGDISIPKYAGSNVAWADEVEEAADGAGAWEEVNLTPKRLTAFVDVSKQFLLQDSHDAEAMLIRDLADAIAEKLDQTVFGAGEGNSKQPAGLFNGVIAETALDAVAYDDILAIEQKMEEKNASNYKFVVSPAVKYALKGVQKANGLQMVLEGNEIDGINYISSNAVNPKSIAAIDPRSLVIGQWGGIDILVDPYTQASKGCIRLVVNAYFDSAMKSDRIEKVVFS